MAQLIAELANPNTMLLMGNATSYNVVSPTGFVDPDSDWSSEENAYDNSISTYADATPTPADTYTSWLELTHSAILVESIKCYNRAITSGMEVDIYYDASWHNIYSDDPPAGWISIPVVPNQTITAARVRIKQLSGINPLFYELRFGLTPVQDYAYCHNPTDDADISVGIDGYEVGQSYYPFSSEGASYDWWQIHRNAFLFDTSSIPAGATITSATLSLYGVGDYSDVNFDIVIVSGADLANPPTKQNYRDLVNDTVSRGLMNTADWVLTDWNVIMLNATGLSEIVKAGTTKFALRSSRDISMTDPKTDSVEVEEWVDFYDGVHFPKLTVNYTVAGFCQAFIIG